MIELRWVERAVPPEHDGATGYYEKVLQYRLAPTDEAKLGVQSRKDAELFLKVYAWKDVPVVVE